MFGLPMILSGTDKILFCVLPKVKSVGLFLRSILPWPRQFVLAVSWPSSNQQIYTLNMLCLCARDKCIHTYKINHCCHNLSLVNNMSALLSWRYFSSTEPTSIRHIELCYCCPFLATVAQKIPSLTNRIHDVLARGDTQILGRSKYLSRRRQASMC